MLHDDPIDYSDEEILDTIKALYQERINAIMVEPEPDIDRVKSTYSEACQASDDEEFARQIGIVREVFDDPGIELEILAVARTPGRCRISVILYHSWGWASPYNEKPGSVRKRTMAG